MSTDSERAKFAALRARTDRQLVGLIHNELQRGLEHASASSAKERDYAEQHRAKAERACTNAIKLLPVIYGLSESERRRIEAELRELGALLDRLSAPGDPKVRTASA